MRVAITQPNFLPWLGYFDLLDTVDCFVELDDVQLVRRSPIVRNKIVDTKGTPRWIGLSVARCHQKTPLNLALVSAEPVWWDGVLHGLDNAYCGAPHWPETRRWLADTLPPCPGDTVAAYNSRLLHAACEALGMASKIWHRSSEILGRTSVETPEDQIIGICRALGASDYFNFRKGIEIGLYSPARFAESGLQLWRQDYRHPVYRQAAERPFASHLSVVDLLAWHGPDNALEIMRSGRAWKNETLLTAA